MKQLNISTIDTQEGIDETPIGETLFTDYSVHELPSETPDSFDEPCYCTTTMVPKPTEDIAQDRDSGLIHAALITRIEFLEAQNKSLIKQLGSSNRIFRLSDIEHNDILAKFYTGFSSYEVLLLFFEFRGPAVYNLQYWGSESVIKHYKKKLDSLNQLFLTLIKLRLDLKERDLADRFGISVSSVSKYFITWVCFYITI